MLKRMLATLIAVLCLLAFAACGTEKAPEPTAPTEEVTEAPTAESTEAPTEEPTEESTEAPTEEPTEAPTEAPDTPAGSYVNFDKMQFMLNGKTYTLGKTTLQTMIDDGVPFDADSLANAENNLNKNSSSQGLLINLTEHWSVQVSVLNDTEGNKPMSECYIHQIYYSAPWEGETTDALTFAFPLDMTIEELKTNAGDPTETYHYDSDDGDAYSDTLEYIKDSDRYINDMSYSFSFRQGVLDYAYITFYP